MKLTITKRAADFHVCVHGQPQFWAAGQSVQEAIGDLVMSHPELFRLESSAEWNWPSGEAGRSGR